MNTVLHACFVGADNYIHAIISHSSTIMLFSFPSAAAPDAPLLIKNESNMIAWVTPNNNGEEIDKYILRYIDE